MKKDIIEGDDGLHRCWWCGSDQLYVRYHDHEWGRPVTDDRRLFEKICLEGFQAGLSWLTILRKRDAFRDAFHNFDMQRVSRMNQRDVDRLCENPEIVRHSGKIKATINNAQRALALAEEYGGLSDYFWSFKPAKWNPRKRADGIPSQTVESAQLSKDLKRRGWRFVGQTTCYSFMQAMGIVNDHLVNCHVFEQIQSNQT